MMTETNDDSAQAGSGAGELPRPANDNWPHKPEWMTTAEMKQHIRRVREEMRRELIADFSLRNCPEHRHFWESLNGLEAFVRWHDERGW